MKRHVRGAAVLVAIWLAVGALATVLVALGCWLYPWGAYLSHDFGVRPASVSDEWWTVERLERIGCRCEVLRKFKAVWLPSGQPTFLETRQVNTAGWPVRALVVRKTGGSQVVTSLAMPLEPLWPGFAIDTACYGGPVGLIFIARALKRRARVRRNCCPACNYPRAGLPPGALCPECGPTPSGQQLKANSQ